MCTAELISWGPAINPHPPPAFWLIYEGAIGQPRYSRWHLFVTPLDWAVYCACAPESAEREEGLWEGHAEVHRLDPRTQNLQNLCTKKSRKNKFPKTENSKISHWWAGLVGCPRNKQKKFGFEPKQTETRSVSVCFVKPKIINFDLFRFVSVFRPYIETTETNTVSKQTETNRNNPKFSEKYQIWILSNGFGWSSVCFGSIETSKLSVSV